MKALERIFPILLFDKRRVEQVLYNLLTNAVKFTRQGMIKVKGQVRTENVYSEKYMLEVTVEDRGIGMSADEAASVFDGFY